MAEQATETIKALRQEVFEEVFDEFAFLTLKRHAPELLYVMMEGMLSKRRLIHAPMFEPYAFLRVFIAGAARYVATGQAQAFYEESKSRFVSKLTVCTLCQHGEHQRCYIDGERFWYCVCPCSRSMSAITMEEGVPTEPTERSPAVTYIMIVVIALAIGALMAWLRG